MGQRQRVDGLLKFPGGLWVQPEVLGTRISVSIGGQAVDLTFPISKAGSTHLRAPEPAVAGARPMPDGLSVLSPSWGYVSSIMMSTGAQTYVVETVVASFLGTRDPTKLPTGFSEFDTIANSFIRWWHIGNEWLSCWSGKPSDSASMGRDSVLRVISADGVIAGSGALLGKVALDMESWAADASQVMAAFDHASREEEVSLPHRFLLAARNAIWADDYRRVVIEAGTAAEVGLAAAIRDILMTRNVEAAFIDSTIRNANGVVGLYEQYVALSGQTSQSKGRVMNQLAVPRNLAAHTGKNPSGDEAAQALKVSGALVQDVAPLPAPGPRTATAGSRPQDRRPQAGA